MDTETTKTYAPKPQEHPVEVDISRVIPEKRAEVKGLILKNHLPPTPFSVQFPNDILLNVSEIEVVDDEFRVFSEVKQGDKVVLTGSPWLFRDVSLKAPNGTWDKETDTENEEVDYRRAFEVLVIGKLRDNKLI